MLFYSIGSLSSVLTFSSCSSSCLSSSCYFPNPRDPPHVVSAHVVVNIYYNFVLSHPTLSMSSLSLENEISCGGTGHPHRMADIQEGYWNEKEGGRGSSLTGCVESRNLWESLWSFIRRSWSRETRFEAFRSKLGVLESWGVQLSDRYILRTWVGYDEWILNFNGVVVIFSRVGWKSAKSFPARVTKFYRTWWYKVL